MLCLASFVRSFFLFFFIIKIVLFSFSFCFLMRHQISVAEYQPIRNRNWGSKYKIVSGTVCVGQSCKREKLLITPMRHCQRPKIVWAISPGKYRNFRNLSENISNSKFLSGWLKLPIHTGEEQNPNLFHWRLILKASFSPGNFPRWIQSGYWGRVFK